MFSVTDTSLLRVRRSRSYALTSSPLVAIHRHEENGSGDRFTKVYPSRDATRSQRFDLQSGWAISAVWNQRLGDGGPDRDRTGDLMNAIHARSQLRHRPISGDEQPIDFSRPQAEGQSVSQKQICPGLPSRSIRAICLQPWQNSTPSSRWPFRLQSGGQHGSWLFSLLPSEWSASFHRLA